MDRKVDWSPEAVEDLESIGDYIARDSERYARAVVSRIASSANRLGGFPLIGRAVPELNDETVRERFVYSYRLVYRVKSDSILIIAVIHGKRLLESIQDRL